MIRRTLESLALIAFIVGVLAGGVGLLFIGWACVKFVNGFDAGNFLP